MGVDLMLLPIDHLQDGWGFSHTVLPLDRATELWEKIRALPSEAVPESFTTYVCRDDGREDVYYGNTQDDGYGERLHCTRVADLLPLAHHPRALDSPRNRAAWAYLGKLPPHTRVALYWH